MKKTLLLLATTTTLTLASTGAAFLEKKCASCHMLEAPEFHQIPTLKAPPMDSIVFHINLAIEDEKEKKVFIADYVLNPDVSKTVCESNKVAKYGVMPSQKGNVTEAELALIATEMLEKYPHPKFVTMIKEMLTNDKMKALQTSPFLVNNESLPHMTKLLIQK